MKRKIRDNFKALETLEKKQWYNIAINRLYYVIFQSFIHYIKENNLDSEFDKFQNDQKEKAKQEDEKVLGSHEMTFTFLLDKLKELNPNIEADQIINKYYRLKQHRNKADYIPGIYYDVRAYKYERDNFDNLVEELKNINVINI